MKKIVISNEISNVTLLIRKLIKFKNENYFSMYSGGLNFKLKTFLKNGVRYEFRFRRFTIAERGYIGEDFPIKKEYKSINGFLHDLKNYRNDLQKKYTEAAKLEQQYENLETQRRN